MLNAILSIYFISNTYVSLVLNLSDQCCKLFVLKFLADAASNIYYIATRTIMAAHAWFLQAHVPKLLWH